MSKYQKVYDNGIKWDGDEGKLEVLYESSSSEVSGLGLRIHYDSSSMTVKDVDANAHGGLLIGPYNDLPDDGDFDSNDATDLFVNASWASAQGNWPGTTGVDEELVLVEVTFEKVSSGSGNFEIDYTSASNAAGFDFIGEPKPPMSVVLNSVDEGTGENQVIATVENASPGVTFALEGGPSQVVDTAHVYVSSAQLSEDGSQITVDVSYKSDVLTSGLGLNIHFDSSKATIEDVNVTPHGALVIGPNELVDTANADEAVQTDKMVGVNFVSALGGWPGANLVKLATLTLNVDPESTDPIDINFSSSSTPPGVEFKAHNPVIDPSQDDLGIPVSPLSIDPSTGEITLADNPDFEAASQYDFKVIASGYGDLNEAAAATFLVGNIDELSPIFDSDEYAVVVEGVGANQVVYTAKAHDDDGDLTSEPLTYSLSDNSEGLFTIDESSGEVRLSVDPDFEGASQSYTFTVKVTDGAGLSALQDVTLTVENKDDTGPIIDSSPVAVAIDENSGVNQIVYKVEAHDSDNDLTSEPLSYSLATNADDDSALFTINSASGEVTLTDNPDFEAKADYVFTVVASDAAQNSVSQTVTLAINNIIAPPIFDSGSIANDLNGDEPGQIDENTPAGQVVYKVEAHDDPADTTSEPLTYSLVDDSDGAFSFDSSTGEVRLLSSPDFESFESNADASYAFVVRATDGDGHSTDQTVTLRVNDIFDINPIIPAQSVSIDENLPLSYQVQASVDPMAGDYGVGEALTYELVAGGDVFTISEDSGIVTYANDYADFELAPNLSFTVKVTDSGGNSSESTISVSIQNIDELRPVFADEVVTLQPINENTGEQWVYKASAIDDPADIDPRTDMPLVYSLKNTNGPFSIDSVTGDVTLDESPDFENIEAYTFTVVATDGALNSSEQVVTLPVIDLDELKPIFDSDDVASAIDENSGSNQVVYKAQAHDDANDVTSEPLGYSLDNDAEDDSELFKIDGTTGDVTLIHNPNFEAKANYTFTVVAMDASQNSSSKTVTLAINNIDDTAPIFDSANTSTVVDNTDSGQMVYVAVAHDNANDVTTEPLTYSLSDNSNGLFVIDSVTGEVTLNEAPDYEATPDYSFTVVATDGVGKSSSQQVTLSVANIDDTAPIVLGTEVPVTLSSFSGANQTVFAPVNDSNLQFEAAFDDESDVISEPLTFEISFDADNAIHADDFSIDEATGVVTYLPDPYTDLDTLSIFYTVTATDASGNTLPEKSSVDLEVIISGKEFNVPLFNYELVVDENGGPVLDADGQKTYQAVAVESGFTAETNVDVVQNEGTEYEKSYNVVTAVSGDLDSSVTDGSVIYTAVVADATPVKFALVDVSSVAENSVHNQNIYTAVSSGRLEIDENTGAVTIHGTPWVDGAEEYTFAVIATDSSGNQSRQDVTLAVNDYAVAPKESVDNITYSLKWIEVPVDEDDEQSGLVEMDYEGSVQINSQTGQVYLLDSANYEDNAQYEFIVVIDDNNGDIREQVVIVDTVNTDDVAPTVESGDSATSVDENSGAGHVVYTASADDSVDGSGVITFSLTEESDPALSIDATSGQVTLDVNPDYEGQSSYSFAVVATDDAGNSSEPKSVSLSIGDKDEINPVISSAANASVDENIVGDQVIYTAVASDPVAQKERGPIAIEFDQNEDGVVTLKLFVDRSLATEFENDLQGIQFDLNYASDSFGAITLDSISYTSSPFVKAVSEGEGSLGFALTYLSDDAFAGAEVYGLYDASSTVAIAEVSFNVGPAAGSLDFSISDVGIIEDGLDLVTRPSGQSSYSLDLDNAVDTYSLGVNSDGDLAINPLNGQVSVVAAGKSVDFEQQSEYSFSVIATDLSGNETEQQVLVTVNDLDEKPAILLSSGVNLEINENSGANQVVYTAAANDSMDISNGITYSLSNANNVFSIDAITGEVTLRENPNFESQSEYSFTVIASDGLNTASEKTITLKVLNLDEIAPSFDSITPITIDENLPFGAPIFNASTTDTHVGEAKGDPTPTYSLTTDSDQGVTINNQTGVVRLLSNADYESQAKYNFTVVVTDDAGNSSHQDVTVRLNNLDEQAPIITSAIEVSISEDVSQGKSKDTNAGENQVVYRTAADDSADISGGLSYAFNVVDQNGNEQHLLDDGPFAIDQATGVVTLNHAPDYELHSSYKFTVVVKDAAGHVAKQDVKLTVDNMDETAPVINGLENDVIVENSGAGNVIYSATADDSADTSDGVIFSLSDDSDAGLMIDAQSGDVTLLHNPDFESGKTTYSFTVIATDAEENQSSKQVDIKVDDLDHVNVTHWSSGVGIANVEVGYSGDRLAVTDSAGQWTGQSNDAITNVVVSKNATEADKNAIDVGDALAALELVSNQDRDNDSFAVKAANVVEDDTLDIGDVLSILKFAAGIEDNTNLIGNWRFSEDPVKDHNNDLQAHQGYLMGDVDGSWGTYSARTTADNQVTIHIDAETSGKVFSYDVRAMDIHSVGEGLSVTDGVISLSAAVDYELRPSMSFTLRDKASGELLVHNVKVENVDEVAPSFISNASASIKSNLISGDVIYTAAADDSGDYSAGVLYSLKDEPAGLSINPITGEVTSTLSAAELENTTFTVIASDGVDRGARSEQTVTISLKDADTTAPVLSGESYQVDETSKAGDLIYTVTTGESVTYSLARGSDKGVQIDQNGHVTLVNDANFEHQHQYNFTVIAEDNSGNRATHKVEGVNGINVTNLDEVAPVITSVDEAVSIDENSGADQVIYTATADDAADISGGVTFSLSADSDAALSIIDASTGEVTLNADPDHEAQSQYSFSVVATDAAGNLSSKTVTLKINNLDDLAPEIAGSEVVAIDENSGAYQVVYTATADDSMDVSGGVTFALSSESHSALSIDKLTGDVTLAIDPEADLLGLDPDHDAIYNFTVIATDAAGNSSVKPLALTVNDLDDTAPEITSGGVANDLNDYLEAGNFVEVDGQINENSGAGQVVYTAIADDSADKAITPVTFRLTADSDSALSIDYGSGEVTLAVNPDHEIQDNYTFTVVAEDGAGNASQAQTVTLEVNDLDDAAPLITSGDTAVAIDENSGTGQVVYTATADDSADVSEESISFSLSAGSDAALSIDASTGEVTLNADPDHEAQSQYSFSVIATDAAGNESLAQSVTLNINDLHEFSPTFVSDEDSSNVDLTIDENSGHNQLIFTAQADANDDSLGDTVTYSIHDHDQALAINAVTGDVFLLINPDADLGSSGTVPLSYDYSFTVRATDKGGQSSDQLVTLRVNNIDDTAPELLGNNSVSFAENITNLNIYTAKVVDSADVSDGVSFSLAEGSDPSLSINAETGVVSLSSAPNLVTDYSFTVIATDAAGNVGAGKDVTVSVSNVDTVAPTITSGSIGDVVVENDLPLILVYTATADDHDFTGNEVVTFKLLDQTTGDLVDESGGFKINPVSGEVYTGAPFNYEDQSQHTFIVVAADASGNRSVAKPVTVGVENVDDTAPVIVSSGVSDIMEASGAGQVVYIAEADDSADVSAGDITFALSDETNLNEFSIDPVTGEVKFLIDPKFDNTNEEINSYSFGVIANDGQNVSIPKQLSFNVLSANVRVPEVLGTLINDDGENSGSIDENSGSNLTIFASETIPGLTYSMETEHSDLVINSSTGDVVLLVNPDADVPNFNGYEFTITATNALDESANRNFTVSVNDLDDSAPVITSGDVAEDSNLSLPGQIDENSGENQVIYKATADDSADISNGPVTFSLAGSIDALEIDPETGEVSLLVNPDYEAQSLYSFTVIATDSAGNSSQKAVTLEVGNMDDTAPIFVSSNTATVLDGAQAGTVVYSPVAEDDDSDLTSPVSYTLSQADVDAGLFEISDSNQVVFKQEADFETQASFSFTVIATDGMNNSISQQVSLSVINIDDTPPVVTSGADANDLNGLFAGNIDEYSGLDQIVYTATATDLGDISEDPLTYDLVDNSNGLFDIDSVTGEVRLMGQPQYDSANDSQSSGVSNLSFTITATDGADNVSATQVVTLGVRDIDLEAPVFESLTSGNVSEGVSEIYQAKVSEGESSAVVYTLGQNSDLGLEIDSSSGVVSLQNGTADYEAQASYQFVVIATDFAGNASSQEVEVIIDNVDEQAPVITSTDNIIVVAGEDGEIYTPTATDSDFNTEEAVINFDVPTNGFTINNEGVVVSDSTLSSSVSFELKATDASNNSATKVITVDVATLVEGPEGQSADVIGEIDRKFSQNADGSYNLQLFVADPSMQGIDNMDFKLTYDAEDIAVDGEGELEFTVNQPSAAPIFNIVNDEQEGVLEVAQIYFPFAYAPSDQLSILDVTFTLKDDVSLASFDVEDVIFGNQNQMGSSFDLVNATQVGGTSDSDVYSLQGGPANVVSGDGNDIFVIADGVDADVVIDFASGPDSIELGSVLAAESYDADSDLLQVAGDTPNLADLIESSSHDLDNAFGAYLDDSTNVLTMFIDSDKDSDAVDIKQYEVTLAEDSSFDDDDLSADLSLFIA